ncbi:hypothetical protein Hypma_002101 [Hypsizygus marmoreus]|uniref:Uncharacterized protein n=1 Tax=Hypsizygus marmoreus TaxID=39966 RepID=A0A369K5B7_HYPMA|nr:hypothetical protein Hypma_002101 [Hypsizygus marmoreus]
MTDLQASHANVHHIRKERLIDHAYPDSYKAQHILYQDTFPVPLERMSQREIEQLALAPLRFLTLFGSANCKCPKRTRVLSVPYNEDNNEGLITRLWLVPRPLPLHRGRKSDSQYMGLGFRP